MRTIRQQLTRRLLWTVGLLFAVSSAAVYLCARVALIAQFDTALNAKTQAITTLVEEKRQRLEIEFSDERMRSFDTGGGDYFELWQADGKSVESSPSLRDVHLTFRGDLSEEPIFWNLALPNGEPARAIGIKFVPEHSDDDRKKSVSLGAVLIVASKRSELDHTLAALQWVLVGGCLLSLAATALLVPRVLKRELLPLHQLANETAQIDASSLSARFPSTDLPGELTPITTRLNELLARLEESFSRERQFSSDVAHEFRTPVAELRSLAELSIKLPDTRTDNTDHEVLAIALHLETILTQLLTLSRGEQSSLATKLQRVSLGLLTQQVCEQFQEKALCRQLSLECRVPQDVIADTDPIMFRCILNNLVENAVEYATPRSMVNVEITLKAGRFIASVSNIAPDVDAEDLPHLFKRFWRKDAARSGNGHTGLGLALAKTFALAIGCELTAHLDESKKLTFMLTSANGGN